jgi:hypothetical protein
MTQRFMTNVEFLPVFHRTSRLVDVYVVVVVLVVVVVVVVVVVMVVYLHLFLNSEEV